MARLSIIVPCLNEAAVIAGLLNQLQPLRRGGHEVIVVDGGSGDGTRAIVEPLADHLLCAPRGRARQMNAGAARAGGDILWFLHADSVLPSAADDAVLAALARSGRVWGRFDVRLSSSRPLLRLVATMMNLRSRLTGIASGDQGMFVRRAVFESVDGFPDLELMEDVALSRRLKRVSPPVCLRDTLITSSRRWERRGTLRTIGLMWGLRLAYFLGVHPDRLALWYGDCPLPLGGVQRTLLPSCLTTRGWQNPATFQRVVDPGKSPLFPLFRRGRQEKTGLRHPPGARGRRFPSARILIFAKAPRPGAVKTRLIPVLGEQGAAELHGRLLEGVVSLAVQSGLAPVECWCAPDDTHPVFAGLKDRYGIEFHTQRGSDLGQRMFHAARNALVHADSVLLIGVDCAVLAATHLVQALQWLAAGTDAVLGPAEDGGYVLMGLSRVDDALFREMPWGGEQVAELTRERLRGLRWTWRELEPLWDVDRPSDLERLDREGLFARG